MGKTLKIHWTESKKRRKIRQTDTSHADSKDHAKVIALLTLYPAWN